MVVEEVNSSLYRSCRPGYPRPRGPGTASVPLADVDAWIREVKGHGIRSIICLLGTEQLRLYPDIPEGLIAHYRRHGFAVEHIPTIDHQDPPLTNDELELIRSAFERLPKPVLIHCSAGVDRTGWAVDFLRLCPPREQQTGT